MARARRNTTRQEAKTDAGCWSAGLVALAAFFLIGALVSLFNGEMLLALEAIIICAVTVGCAIWLRGRAR